VFISPAECRKLHMGHDIKSLWFGRQAQEKADVLKNSKFGDKQSERDKTKLVWWGQLFLVSSLVCVY